MLAPTSFTWMATWALRAFIAGVSIGPPEKAKNIYACAYVYSIGRLAHICQAIYNAAHAQEAKTISNRSALSRPGRSHAAAPPQPHRRQGNLRLLFCGGPQDQPAENLAPSGVSSPRRDRRRASPGALDALSSARAGRLRGFRDLARNSDPLAADSRNAGGFGKT